MTRALADPSQDSSADRLRAAVSQGLEAAKTALERFRADGAKEKVEEREKEMQDLMVQLEASEARLKDLAIQNEENEEIEQIKARAEEPKFEMDDETKKRIEEVDKEAKQGGDSNALLSKIMQECEEFTAYQKQVEAESEAERKRGIEEIAEKAKEDDERFQAQLTEIRNYEITEDSNPQQEEETAEDVEAQKMREKIMEEI